jgi:hypothetical protein
MTWRDRALDVRSKAPAPLRSAGAVHNAAALFERNIQIPPRAVSID